MAQTENEDPIVATAPVPGRPAGGSDRGRGRRRRRPAPGDHGPVPGPVPARLAAAHPQRRQRRPPGPARTRHRRRRLRNHHARERVPASQQSRLHLRSEHGVRRACHGRDLRPAARRDRSLHRLGRTPRRDDRLQARAGRPRAQLALVGGDPDDAGLLRIHRRTPGDARVAPADPLVRRDPGRLPAVPGHRHHHPGRC